MRMQSGSNLTAARGDLTRDALIEAGILVFGRDGFHSASTRVLAETAEVNQALIGYHFRNKEGLYLAVLENIAAKIRQNIAPLAKAIDEELANQHGGEPEHLKRERAFELLFKLTDRLLAIMVSEESSAFAQIILREQQTPSSAFDVLFEGYMRHLLGMVCKLVERLRPSQTVDDARLIAVTILGQVLAFRAAHAGILRYLDWNKIGPAELAKIQARVRRNVRAQILISE